MPKKPAPQKNKHLLSALAVLVIAILIILGITLTAARVGSDKSTSPNAPASQPHASEGCMDSKGRSKCKKTEYCVNNVCKPKPSPTVQKCTAAQISNCASINGRLHADCSCEKPCSAPNSCGFGCTPMNRGGQGYCPTGQTCCTPEL